MPKPKKETPLIPFEQFERVASAIMQVSKEELAEVVAAEDRENPEKRRGRPTKSKPPA